MSTPSPFIFDATTADFAERVVAASHQQPVLVDFWAAWCGPCRTLAPMLDQLAASYGGGFLLAKVDTEAEPALATEHGIRSLPTVRLYSNGAMVEEFMGVQPESNIRALLDRHVARASDAVVEAARAQIEAGAAAQAVEALQQALIDDPGNQRIHPVFANALFAENRLDDAEAVLNALPPEARNEGEAKQIRSQIALARGAASGVSEACLREKVDANPKDCEARLNLSALLAQSGQAGPAMDELLEVLRIDRAFGDGVARERLLQMFDVLGGDPLVTEYRRKMAQALF